MTGEDRLRAGATFKDQVRAKNLLALNQAARYWAIRRGLTGDSRFALGLGAACLVITMKSVGRGSALEEVASVGVAGLLLVIGAIFLALLKRPVILPFLGAGLAALGVIALVYGILYGPLAAGILFAGFALLLSSGFFRSYRSILQAYEQAEASSVQLMEELTQHIFKEDARANTRLIAFKSSPHRSCKWRARLLEGMILVVKKRDATAPAFLSGGDAFFSRGRTCRSIIFGMPGLEAERQWTFELEG